jgi:hypothetical protein
MAAARARTWALPPARRKNAWRLAAMDGQRPVPICHRHRPPTASAGNDRVRTLDKDRSNRTAACRSADGTLMHPGSGPFWHESGMVADAYGPMVLVKRLTVSLGMRAGSALTSITAGRQTLCLIRKCPSDALVARPTGHTAGTIPGLTTCLQIPHSVSRTVRSLGRSVRLVMASNSASRAAPSCEPSSQYVI